MSYLSDNISLERANTASISITHGVVTDNTVNSYANLLNAYIADDGGNPEIISLTVDVLNKDDLKYSNGIVNANWVNDKRKRSNLIESKAIWGFKEAYHGVKKSRAISNAFCFADQKLAFHIAQEGHSNGYIDNQWVYCTTSIAVSVVDVFDGTETTLKTFDNFELALGDDSRYFEWTVPEKNVKAYADYGVFGLYVIKIDVSNTYYEDAQRQTVLEGNYPSSNQSCLQLLTYDGVQELLNVNAGDLSIMPPTPSANDTMAEAFNNTIFDSLTILNDNELTEDQKRAIISDQCAVLFMSQHPVLTADFYPGKILGVGIDNAVQARKVVDKAVTYAQRYPNVVPLIKDRLFGMVATYRAFNFATDIESYIPDNTQSNQVIKDPIRSILMDVYNVVSDDMGVDGLSFNPYAMEVVNVDFLHDAPVPLSMTVSLYEGIIDINNIQMTKANGNPLWDGDNAVKVSFDVVRGESNIVSIKYILFTEQSNNYTFYYDNGGTSRSHTFNPLPYGPIQSVEFNEGGDIVTAQIVIEDIYGGITSFTAFEWIDGYVERPSVLQLKLYQRTDGSDIVDVYYTYRSLSEINNSYVYVQFSVDEGVTWSNVATNSLKGDFGANVQPGRRVVSWKPALDLDGISVGDYILCRVTVYDTDNNIAVGKTVSGALVIDTSVPSVFICVSVKPRQNHR